MSLFPIIQPQLIETDTTLPLYREAAWDFENGKPIFRDGNPVFVTGAEAIKIWIWKALITQRPRYEIYSFSFGSDLETLVGRSWSLDTRQAEAVRYAREALEINPYITDISNIQVSFSDGTLFVSTTVETIYGEVMVNV